MKENLLYLWALVCSLTLFATRNSSDDDSDNKNSENPLEEEAVITAPGVIKTYWGDLDISMIPGGSGQEIVIGDGVEKFIILSQVNSAEVKIELRGSELFISQQILRFEDIVIDKCEVKKEEDMSIFTRQQDFTSEGDATSLGNCPITVTGTAEGGNADITINMKVPVLQQTVKITYSGVKQVAEPNGA